jgi:hypothetical protein
MRYKIRFAAATVRYVSVGAGFGGRAGHERSRDGPRTGAEKATDGAGGSGYYDRSHPDCGPDLPFQDACSVSLSLSSPGSGSASWVPRASVMRWLAAVAGAGRDPGRAGQPARDSLTREPCQVPTADACDGRRGNQPWSVITTPVSA